MLTKEQQRKHKVIKGIIDQAGGTIFRAWFVKKNGEVRPMLAKRKVTKGVKGIGRTYDPDEKGHVPVFDMEHQNKLIAEGIDDETAASKSFRNITSDKVFALKIRGTLIKVGEVPEGFELPKQEEK